MLIGAVLAENLGLELGDSVTVMSTTAARGTNAITLEIVGLAAFRLVLSIPASSGPIWTLHGISCGCTTVIHTRFCFVEPLTPISMRSHRSSWRGYPAVRYPTR